MSEEEPGAVAALLPDNAALLLGVALVLAVTDPTRLAGRGPIGWLAAACGVVAAIWAAPVVARRPAVDSVRPINLLARHRNTAFAVGCTVAAGFSDPPVWLMAVDAGLLLAYLLVVDALAAGPVGARQLARGTAPLAALAAIVIVLLAARAPVSSGAVWGRIVAAIAVAVAAVAAGAALWIRQPGTRESRSAQEQRPAPARGHRR
jgi:hypothetical protein